MVVWSATPAQPIALRRVGAQPQRNPSATPIKLNEIIFFYGKNTLR
jgi:hypothetical protein